MRYRTIKITALLMLHQIKSRIRSDTMFPLLKIVLTVSQFEGVNT